MGAFWQRKYHTAMWTGEAMKTTVQITSIYDEAEQGAHAFAQAVAVEIERARSIHAPMHSMHEGYAVILEEVDELWQHVKAKQWDRQPGEIRKELVQIAAMCGRMAIELGPRYDK
jgi:hypothetical protein